MATLTLDLFTGGLHDYERAQYQILSGLQEVRSAFSRNCIFPHFGELLHLHQTLQTILEQSEDFRNSLPGRIKEIDLEEQRVIYERQDLSPDQLGQVEDLIRWSMPLLGEAVDEGRTIFEFVEENLHLEEVGIIPSYLQEGYLLLPDGNEDRLHVLQYSLSIFSGADARYRSLKTSHVETIPLENLESTPQQVKLKLMAERKELPNPATYYFGTSLDFPYEPTLLPVAKRKFMRYLYRQQSGTA